MPLEHETVRPQISLFIVTLQLPVFVEAQYGGVICADPKWTEERP